MARRALACTWACVLGMVLSMPASAEEREVPRVGMLVVPGVGGTMLAAITTVCQRPPCPQASRTPTWMASPPGLPRATLATLWRIAF